VATEYLSTKEAAEKLGYSVQHTRLLIRQGKLKARKPARDWLVVGESVAQYQKRLDFPNKPDRNHPRRLSSVVNVATVPFRSPFRYPGGKTWLVPRIRQWLSSDNQPRKELIEPFAGGAIVGLSAVFEGLVERVTLGELDEDVASVWRAILYGEGEWLADQITAFEMTAANVQRVLARADESVRDRAFATIVRNRINRGGILAPGAGVVKKGENGKGLRSRWYPDTLRKRILNILKHKDRIDFVQKDALTLLEEKKDDTDVSWFIDPPYVVAGRRLYKYSEIDHDKLLALAGDLSGDFLITYDDSPQIEKLAETHGLAVCRVPMKNTHHQKKMELLIGPDLSWLAS